MRNHDRRQVDDPRQFDLLYMYCNGIDDGVLHNDGNYTSRRDGLGATCGSNEPDEWPGGRSIGEAASLLRLDEPLLALRLRGDSCTDGRPFGLPIACDMLALRTRDAAALAAGAGAEARVLRASSPRAEPL